MTPASLLVLARVVCALKVPSAACRRGGAALVLAFAAAIASAPSAAQSDWPAKPIHIVVPFPPGGSTDLLARRIGEKLQASLGQPVVIDNRGGAGGTIGSGFVAKAPADGYTLLMGVTGTNAISASLYSRLPYSPGKDFVPVSLVVSAPLVLVKTPAYPPKSVADLVRALKAKPASASFGSAGNGTSMHLTGEMFKQAAGVSMVHIPYKGSAGMLQDLMAGTIEVSFADFLVVWPQLQAGKVEALAVTSANRHPMLAQVPTIAESGYPGFEALSWQGVFTPAATPPAVVERLNREINKALASPDLQEFFSARGFILGGSTAAEFRGYVDGEIDKWARIVRTSGAKPD